jgi:ribosome-associated protein
MTGSEENGERDIEIEAQLIELTRQPIELYKILKFEGLVSSGGEAKAAIADGHVMLNDVVETQKRKKIVSGDVIEFAGQHYLIQCEAPMTAAKEKIVAPAAKTAKVSSASKAPLASKTTKAPKGRKPAVKKAGRKAIGIKS